MLCPEFEFSIRNFDKIFELTNLQFKEINVSKLLLKVHDNLLQSPTRIFELILLKRECLLLQIK